MNDETLRKLKEQAKIIRSDIFRMAYRAQSAHSGGAYSCVEILVYLYFYRMRIDPKKPLDLSRDRLVFSKGHDAKALYAILARRGFFDPSLLDGYELDGGALAGHTTRGAVPGIEVSSGSLGHGLPIAVGMALAGKKQRKTHAVYAILSDGECDEGTTWESALFAAHHGLENLVVIIDYNRLQGYGYVDDVISLKPFGAKWRSFGWAARSCNGHSFRSLHRVCSIIPFQKGKPSVIIANTIKGKGGPLQHVNQVSSQYVPPTKEEYEKRVR